MERVPQKEYVRLIPVAALAGYILPRRIQAGLQFALQRSCGHHGQRWSRVCNRVFPYVKIAIFHFWCSCGTVRCSESILLLTLRLINRFLLAGLRTLSWQSHRYTHPQKVYLSGNIMHCTTYTSVLKGCIGDGGTLLSVQYGILLARSIHVLTVGKD